jgi:hypothetical protein
MRTWIIRCTVLLGLLMSTGCLQSAYLRDACSSDDGWVIAFQDDCHKTVWVADRDSHRPIAQGTGSGLMLSPNGRFLLLLTHDPSNVLHSCVGNRMQLIDLTTNETWNAIAPWPEDLFRDDATVQIDPDGSFTLWVSPRPSFESNEDVFGIIDGSARGWRYTIGKGIEPTDHAPTNAKHFGWSTNGFNGKRVDIERIDYDGWNARRQIWIRPDGSTMEIARQNDLPLMVPRAIVTLPLSLFNYFMLSDTVYVVSSFVAIGEPQKQLARIEAMSTERRQTPDP